MRITLLVCAALGSVLVRASAFAQDPTGTIEGAVADKTGSVIPAARVTAKNLATGFTREVAAADDGFYRLPLLPVGEYSLSVEAPKFAKLVQQPIQVTVSQTMRVDVQLDLQSVTETVTVPGRAQLVDSSTNALGRVVTGREILDLPLNGRNFTQLGLLQTGVAPLTAGVATAGGSLRQGQAYAVDRVHHRPGRQAAVRAELECERSASAVRAVPRRGSLCRRAGNPVSAQHRSESGSLRTRCDSSECRSPPYLCELFFRRRHVRLLDDRYALQYHELDVSGWPGERVASVHGRRRIQRVVLALRVERLLVVHEPFRGRS
jgi:hypothetical protein